MKEAPVPVKYAEKKGRKTDKTLYTRKIACHNERGNMERFITNNRKTGNEEMSLIYNLRRMMKWVSKMLKHHFRLRFFCFGSGVGIKTLGRQITLLVLKAVISHIRIVHF